MKIKKVTIKNYRNLDDVSIYFGEQTLSFLVGENNTGKTNLLDLLDIIFNKRKFEEFDFKNKDNPIEVSLTLTLDDSEIGIFDDYTSPDNANEINLLIKQETPDEYVEVYHKESEEKLSRSKLRYVNFLKYDPLRKPTQELDFYKQKSSGKFLSYITLKHYENLGFQNTQLFNSSKLEDLVNNINNDLQKIKYFREFGLEVNYEEEQFKQILSLLKIIEKDSGIEVTSSGYGVQFSLIIFLHILNHFAEILSSRNKDEFIYADFNNKKYCSIILGIDEPEIHLHPYMQRSLVKAINKILNNKDKEFLQLLKNTFDIDGLIGQAIIVTHSPNILLDDYKQYIRVYRKNSSIKFVPEEDLMTLDKQEEKHFRRQIPYIKEALFSRVVIIVEGDTELGAIPVFLQNLGIDMDEYGITLIKADGVQSILPIKKVLERFDINCIILADRDGGKNENKGFDCLTEYDDFEEDIVNTLFNNIDNKTEEILKEILKQLNKDTQWLDEYPINEDKIPEIKNKILDILRKSKSVNTGKIIAECINNNIECIPEVIKKIAKKIKEDSKLWK